ncbi:oxidoreductase, partial [Streptomyces coelicoflavus]|nr:oxidoreductase [Streptomyces coelicoflavus]
AHGLAVGGDYRADQASPRAAARTADAGRTRHPADTGPYDTVDCTPDLGCWAAGEQGRVARLER